MNALLHERIQATDGAFRCSFSISGTALQQMEDYAPDALRSFQRLAETGAVEFLCETSHHSLSFLGDEDEFRYQVQDQAERIERLFGQRPKTFRNTELIVDNRVARLAEDLGFDTIMAEGADHLLGWRSAHRVYRPEGCERIKALLRSYSFSDDIAFRFSNRGWAEWPLTADRFASWLQATPTEDEPIGLFMDYETFGEHQWVDTGIFDFMRALPGEILADERFHFATPSELSERTDPVGRLDIPHPVSWADAERDLTAWMGNHMQRGAFEACHALGGQARRVGAAGRNDLLRSWRKLTTSDHFYYMCVKFSSDGDVHKYFSPYATPHDAYIAYMNVIDDLARRLDSAEAALEPTNEVSA
jgi:alpha-amylase